MPCHVSHVIVDRHGAGGLEDWRALGLRRPILVEVLVPDRSAQSGQSGERVRRAAFGGKVGVTVERSVAFNRCLDDFGWGLTHQISIYISI